MRSASANLGAVSKGRRLLPDQGADMIARESADTAAVHIFDADADYDHAHGAGGGR